MLLALIDALILCACIKVLTDDDVNYITLAIWSFVVSFISSFLAELVCAPIDSVILKALILLAIYFVLVAIMVQLLCSTDLKRVMFIAGLFIGIKIVLIVCFVILLTLLHSLNDSTMK